MVRAVLHRLLVSLLCLVIATVTTAARQVPSREEHPGFTDLAGHWAASTITILAQAGVVQGFPTGEFRPDNPASRLEAVVLLTRVLGLEARTTVTFADQHLIPAWAQPQVAAAAPLVKGIPDSRGRVYLRPAEPLSRLQLGVLAGRSLALLGATPTAKRAPSLAKFRDAAAIPAWARSTLEAAVAAGLLAGDPAGYLHPYRLATRAELATIAYRLWQRAPVPGGDGGGPSGGSPPTSPGRSPGNGTAPKDGGAGTPGRPYVVGFYARSTATGPRALDALRRNPGVVTMVAEFGFSVNASGQLKGTPDVQLRKVARSQGIPLVAVIHNDPGSGFNRQLVHTILTTPRVREKTIAAVVDFARQHGFDGINLDFENIDPADRQAYTAFVRDLASALRAQGLTLSVSVPAKTTDDPAHPWSGAYDYAMLGKLADFLIIMAYDEHWFGGEPGPVASRPWVQAVIAYARRTVPVAKIIVGLPTYGYDWALGSGAQTTAFPGSEGLHRAAQFGVTVQWDDHGQVPFFSYVSGGVRHLVYFENAHSLRAKLTLVQSSGLPGIALWRLGFEDPEVWPLLHRFRQGRPLMP